MMGTSFIKKMGLQNQEAQTASEVLLPTCALGCCDRGVSLCVCCLSDPPEILRAGLLVGHGDTK